MITRHTCKNGLRVVFEQIPTVRSAAVGVWIGTGSRHENEHNNGVSHFLEHMLFKGTKERSARKIAEEFDRIGGHVNAFTSKEYTCYYAKVLDNHAEHALEVLGDMFFNSVFDPAELEKEKNVVLEEIKMYEDTPDDIVHDLLGEAVYGNHPLGYPILGTEQTIRSFSQDSLKQYVYEMYRPEDVVISVAGNVDPSFIQKVEALFGDYQSKGQNRTEPAKPSFHYEQLSKKKETEQAHLCFGFEGLPIGHEDTYSLIIMNNVLGGSMSSRLFQDVREDKGLAYSVFSYHSAHKDNGLLTVYAGTGADQLDELFSTVKTTLDSFKKNGMTEQELSFSKEQLKGNLMLGLESTNARMSRNGKNELMLGRHRSMDELITRIDEVTLDSVNRVTQQVLTDRHATSIISPKEIKPYQHA
ncbi:pitrilysin family protein [Jeotgalibacillus sp. R-1-5s-1]|uniref:M16 family metallopeptidase n=1 Tax=Jeotgalibacillus sp. R-1-5s-1 TaxID=2555897 RepID=UPI00106D5D13|nr:pitrilysin family protein [Jeotgalibacillus sp. R-1-5s-1]TFE03451.1 insulinase family protein [Jeotgalibacillus sp. R-1-5s-1]